MFPPAFRIVMTSPVLRPRKFSGIHLGSAQVTTMVIGIMPVGMSSAKVGMGWWDGRYALLRAMRTLVETGEDMVLVAGFAVVEAVCQCVQVSIVLL